MKPRLFITAFIALTIVAWANAGPTDSPVAAPHYETRAEHDPNGIGKFYMGREIAHVMGHQAADWLERPEREQEERPDLLVPALKLKPGDAVADIGAGRVITRGGWPRRLAVPSPRPSPHRMGRACPQEG